MSTDAVVVANPHAEEDALLRAILGAAGDRGPKLAYAAWMETQGQIRRAALARREPQVFATRAVVVPERWRGAITYANLNGGLLFVTGQMRGLLRSNFGTEGAAWLHRQRVFSLDLNGRTKDWTRVAEMPWLGATRGLGLDRAALQPGDLAKLLASPHLGRLLSLSLGSLRGDAVEAMTALVTATTIPQLCSLSFWSTRLSPEALEPLLTWPGARQLVYLAIPDAQIGTAISGLATNERFSGLTHLILGGNPLGVAGMQAFLEGNVLTSLRRLEMWACRLDDTCLHLLAASPRLASLRHLNLRGNRFSFAALQHLAQSPYITAPCDVIVTTYNLTAAQQQQLRAQYNERGLFVCFT